jgi:hypothetical protein
MRQIIKQGQPNFILFFHDFDDSQRVTFYAYLGTGVTGSETVFGGDSHSRL